MTSAEWKHALREKALSLGFGDCRVARAGPAPHAAEFRQWIADGCHGDMTWMAKGQERRSDPREVLPGARSMIVLAMSYWQTEPKGRAEKPGVFARYAWGADYHDLISAKLKDLASLIDEAGGRQRCYVDTGPVLERDWASASGLGWNGKSTIQIHPKLGAWFFLAVILTDLDLEPDPPMNDHCGKCERCMDACPTQAITQPRRVDARRCISYLTIEHRGPIPHEFRRPIGARVFGCDDCLAVCPWNRFAQASRESAFQAREFVSEWNLRDFLDLDDEGFRSLFRRSPIKRTKRQGFLRNVCVALGNVGDAEDVPALEKIARADDELLAEHARWALEEIRSRQAKTSHEARTTLDPSYEANLFPNLGSAASTSDGRENPMG